MAFSWADAGDILKDGLSKAVDAEIDEEYRVDDRTNQSSREPGQGNRDVGSTNMLFPGNTPMLAGISVVVLVAVYLIARRL